jgi:N-acetylgalactosamine-6-sulfatase
MEAQSPKQPFLLYVPYTAPHTPLQGPDDYRPEKMTADAWNQGTKQTYVEMIEAMDAGVGRLLATLRSKDIAEQTLVIFFSDNGPTKKGDTGGLRGNKGNVYEGGIRVPCLVRHPGVLPAGAVSDEICISMDLTASILRLAGAAPSQPLDGIDILHSIQTKEQNLSPRTLFWRKRRGEVTVKAMRRGDWKLIVQQDGTNSETFLYNLADDLAEQQDQAATERDRLKEMSVALANWENRVAPQR